MMLKGVERGNGFEAVRQLFRTCQPANRNRALGLLHLLMKWPEFDMKVAMISQILRLEDSSREYERIVGNLSDELRYLNVTLQENTTYDKLREAILQYDQATIKWSNSMALGAQVPGPQDGPVPMEVDRIWKGKDKGKGKQKGKYKDGGGKQQQKGSWSNSGKGYGYGKNDSYGKSGNKGSKGSDNPGKGYQSWFQSGSQNWNKSGKSSSKGKKDKDGKGKDSCHRCGKPGHYARDCRVRLIENEETMEHECGASTSPSTAYTGTATTSGTTSRVNRISAHDLSPSVIDDCPLYFDVWSANDFTNLRVNTISEMHPCENSACLGATSDVVDMQLEESGTVAGSPTGIASDVTYCSWEYIQQTCNDYQLCPLCCVDGFEHYKDVVHVAFSLDAYELVSSQDCVKRFNDSACYKPCPAGSSILSVRAVKHETHDRSSLDDM